ncbi:hypothetical protein LTR47_005539 [Exophiala xenobiotica]|nr:hypothetical protein LTR41_008838 [Exophiala xenobiotica]KAK5233446.1 hypothetical protein LTR47_005539 [Exophiala xenobiotica]KAK5249449.1 hypothetical protein LTS06_005675 [Exophiala xenobiotica]KAK5261443.1 hypothetical protein LTR40_002192 [Exophiala xenobiotica]KAK5314035.1 hypothetical protein LTR93_010565 [Exophiala xenobiotica]
MEVQSPQWGYIVNVPQGETTNLNWSMNADQLKGEFMYLTLHMGNPGYLSEVPNYKIETFYSSYPNPFPIAAEVLDGHTPRSACNYKLRIEVNDVQAYSDYFTIIKANDTTSLNETSLCPGRDGSMVPFSDLRANRNSTLQCQSPYEGISTAVLAGAIVAAFFGACLFLGLLMFVAFKRSWWPFRRRHMIPTEQAAHVCETCQRRDLAAYAAAKVPELETGRRHELASNSMQY